jgi:hypothetical protein
MTRSVIPLVGGSINAHQQFEVQLGDNLVEFEVNYRTLTNRWSMNLLLEGVRIVNGAALTPGSDIIQHWNLGESIGQMVFTGDAVTLDNLGSANTLVWISPDDE